jgi:hypothetical protein
LGFTQKYKKNEGKSDEKLLKILKEWKKPVIINEEEESELEEKFYEEGISREIDNLEDSKEKVKKILEIKEEFGEIIMWATEKEIHKLVNWGCKFKKILNNNIIMEYRKLEIEENSFEDNEEEVKKKLREYIERKVEVEEKLDMEQEDHEKEIEIEDNKTENENIINTGGFDLSENSS